MYCYECNKTSKIYKDDYGYTRFKDSGYPVHRYVAEQRLGRRLKPGEVVHHIDRNKTNNNKYNLWVFKNQYNHDKAHFKDEIRFGSSASYKGFRKKRYW
jgi:hypothetical protein